MEWMAKSQDDIDPLDEPIFNFVDGYIKKGLNRQPGVVVLCNSAIISCVSYSLTPDVPNRVSAGSGFYRRFRKLFYTKGSEAAIT